MKRKSYILVINIGSTSTKLGLFADEIPVFKETLDHKEEDLSSLDGVHARLSFHKEVIDKTLAAGSEDGITLDLIVSRGGASRPLKSGPYLITDAMCNDLQNSRYGWHPTNLGPLIARRIGEERGVPAIIFDSPMTDEMERVARISGLNGIERKAGFHVLNQKSAAKKAARKLGKAYEDLNLVVGHLGGGITICAHRKGRMIDGTHGLNEGPFTPQRPGSLPLKDIMDLSFSARFKKREDLEAYLMGQGGLVSYLGTYNMKEIGARIREGDKEAHLITQAMCYQIAKEIGAMASVLKGEVAAIVLTGNLCYSSLIVEEIRPYVDFIAPIVIFSGDDELENLAMGGLEVLRSGLSCVPAY